jgi:hypothetical protein
MTGYSLACPFDLHDQRLMPCQCRAYGICRSCGKPNANLALLLKIGDGLCRECWGELEERFKQKEETR